MAHVFTVKSNANRKVRATVEQYPDSCKAEDFTVEPLDGGFVVRMMVRDEAGQAFARYHGFEYAVPGIEPAPEVPEGDASAATDAALVESELDPPEGLGHAAAPSVADCGAVAEKPASERTAAGGDYFYGREAIKAAPAPAADCPDWFETRDKARKATEARGLRKLRIRKTDDEAYVIVETPAPAPKARKSCGPAASAAPAPKAPHAGPNKFAAIREAAERGELPPVPDFSADLHKRNRGRLAQLVAMAEAGDVAGLKVFPIKPNCTSPKAMDRYRNLCVIALNVRAAKPEAGVGLHSKSA